MSNLSICDIKSRLLKLAITCARFFSTKLWLSMWDEGEGFVCPLSKASTKWRRFHSIHILKYTHDQWFALVNQLNKTFPSLEEWHGWAFMFGPIDCEHSRVFVTTPNEPCAKVWRLPFAKTLKVSLPPPSDFENKSFGKDFKNLNDLGFDNSSIDISEILLSLYFILDWEILTVSFNFRYEIWCCLMLRCFSTPHFHWKSMTPFSTLSASVVFQWKSTVILNNRAKTPATQHPRLDSRASTAAPQHPHFD